MSDHPAAQLGLGLIGYDEARRQAEQLPSKGTRSARSIGLKPCMTC